MISQLLSALLVQARFELIALFVPKLAFAFPNLWVEFNYVTNNKQKARLRSSS